MAPILANGFCGDRCKGIHNLTNGALPLAGFAMTGFIFGAILPMSLV